MLAKDEITQARLRQAVLLTESAERSQLAESSPHLMQRKRRDDVEGHAFDRQWSIAEKARGEVNPMKLPLGRPSDKVEAGGVLIDNAQLEIETVQASSHDKRPASGGS